MNKKQIFKKKNKPKKQITDDDWEIMRNFKNTELNRNEEGIELEMDKIRIHLNQITTENYDEMKTHIVNILKENSGILSVICEVAQFKGSDGIFSSGFKPKATFL